MSIERSQSAETRQADRAREANKDKPREKEAPPREQVDRFQSALHNKGLPGKGELKDPRQEMKESKGLAEHARGEGSSGQATTDNSQRVGGVDQRDSGGHHSHQQDKSGFELKQTAESVAMLQVHQAIHINNMAMPISNQQAGAFNTQAFSEMVEKHVRQLAISKDIKAGDDGKILLRMNDSTLPGTDLLLSRSPEGRWTLQADTTSRDSYQAINRAVPSLARRFSEAGLGEINIDAQFSG